MMFRRRSKETPIQTPQSAANRQLNRILTYGLVFFIIYTIASSQHGANTQTDAKAPENYTPINWDDYITVKNLSSGEVKLYKSDNGRVEVDAADGNPAYEIEIGNRQNCIF